MIAHIRSCDSCKVSVVPFVKLGPILQAPPRTHLLKLKQLTEEVFPSYRRLKGETELHF